ncbi:MAG: thermonuclease family protein [Chloroflexi bacterium]|nr:thermonuclease family protein [Chloroflexota bacterium]
MEDEQKKPGTSPDEGEPRERDLRDVWTAEDIAAGWRQNLSKSSPDPETPTEPWDQAFDELPSRPQNGAYPPDEYDRHRESGADYGAARLAGVSKLLIILAAMALIVPLFAVLFDSPGSTIRQVAPPPPPRVTARVVEVISGNTIRVEIEDQIAVVRYIGVGISGPNDEFHAISATVNESWLSGKFVELESDSLDIDPEGRLLRYVWVGGAMVNAALLASGLGQYVDNDGNDRYARQFGEIEKNARSRQLGMWDTDGRGA